MLKKCMLPLALAALAMVVVAGCSGSKKVKDEYASVSLHRALYGPTVVSKGWKYKITHPEIVEAVGHILLVREGNVTSMIAGRSIAEKIESMDHSNITFNVVKKYTPYVHFRCDMAYAGADSVFLPTSGAIIYPRISKPEDFNFARYEDVTMNKFRYNDSSGLGRMTEKKYRCSAELARVEEEGEEVWMLVGPRASLRVEKPDDGIEIVLRRLLAEGKGFDGGFTFNEVEDWGERKNNHIAGTVTVNFADYMGKVFSL